MHTISVLIPVYNADRYLSKCLDSVVNQTYQYKKVIIVDDGSTDRSSEICKEYTDKYPFIKLITQKNSGVAAARNTLLSHIDGEYFLFVDSDDWIESDMLEKLMDILTSNNLDIAVCGHVVENDTSNTKLSNTDCRLTTYNQKDSIQLFLYHHILNGSLWNKLIRTEIAKNAFFDTSISYGEDAHFIWQCLQNTNRIGITDARYYHYRVNPESISHQKFGPKKISGHKAWRYFTDETKEKWPELYELASANFAVSDFFLLYFAAKDNYPEDTDILRFRNNLKRNIRHIRKYKLLSKDKLLLATSFVASYSITGKILRFLLKKNKTTI